MKINPSEITNILKDQIKNFGTEVEVSEVGQVLTVGDGIARVYGLDNVTIFGEDVELLTTSVDIEFQIPSSVIGSHCIE